MRTQELVYTLQQLRKADWIDQKRIILTGFSEGAQAVSVYRGEEFAALILVGTDCRHSGGSPATPNGIPVLNIVGSQDEWGYGAGCSIGRKVGGSKGVVFEKRVHDLSGDAEAREVLEHFLEECCARPN
jgi:predicted esterase